MPPMARLWKRAAKHGWPAEPGRCRIDGPGLVARKDGNRVRLYSRLGNDLTYRFPLIVETLARLRSRSCIIDGEAMHAVILV